MLLYYKYLCYLQFSIESVFAFSNNIAGKILMSECETFETFIAKSKMNKKIKGNVT